MTEFVKLLEAPLEYQDKLAYFVNFQVLDWDGTDPVIALYGSRVTLNEDWSWEFEESDW